MRMLIVSQNEQVANQLALSLPEEIKITGQEEIPRDFSGQDLVIVDARGDQGLSRLERFIEKAKGNTSPPLVVLFKEISEKLLAETWQYPIMVDCVSISRLNSCITDYARRKKSRAEDQTGAVDIISRSEEDIFTKGFMTESLITFSRELAAWNCSCQEVRDSLKIERDPFLGIKPATWLEYVFCCNSSDSGVEERLRILEDQMRSSMNERNRSIKLLESFKQVFCQKLAGRFEPLLIMGETGTGKTVLAKLLSKMTNVGEKFEVVNCANIHEQLLESELFGRVPGAYTSSEETVAGSCISNYGGTLFLDEIGELTPLLQAKLLAFLQEGLVKPVGWNYEPMYIPVRVIAATNKELHNLVQRGDFREDLFFRLSYRVSLPPLRERTPELADLILNSLGLRRLNGGRVKGITRAAIDKICDFQLPGNFRELEMVLRQAAKSAILMGDSTIRLSDVKGTELHLPHIEAAFCVPVWVKDGVRRYLLQCNYRWNNNYFFIGGHLDPKLDRSFSEAAAREFQEKTSLSKDVFTLGSPPVCVDLIQYSRTSDAKQAYYFEIYPITFEAPLSAASFAEPRYCWATAEQIMDGWGSQNRPISPSARQVFLKKGAEFNQLQESWPQTQEEK